MSATYLLSFTDGPTLLAGLFGDFAFEISQDW